MAGQAWKGTCSCGTEGTEDTNSLDLSRVKGPRAVGQGGRGYGAPTEGEGQMGKSIGWAPHPASGSVPLGCLPPLTAKGRAVEWIQKREKAKVQSLRSGNFWSYGPLRRTQVEEKVVRVNEVPNPPYLSFLSPPPKPVIGPERSSPVYSYTWYTVCTDH